MTSGLLHFDIREKTMLTSTTTVVPGPTLRLGEVEVRDHRRAHQVAEMVEAMGWCGSTLNTAWREAKSRTDNTLNPNLVTAWDTISALDTRG